MLKKLLLVTLILVAGCGGASKQRLNVYAASSLTESFSTLETEFERENPTVDVQLTLAGSNQLRTQIMQGATADVFAAAATQDMDALSDESIIDAQAVQIFARNRLALIVPHPNPAQISSVQDLTKPTLRLIVADENVPVGRYTVQMLNALNAEYGADFAQRVQANIVSRELNVKQVVTKIRLGEGDAGIVYHSDVTPDVASFIQEINLPEAQNPVASYPIAPLKASNNAALAQQFVDFVLSSDGQTVLQQHGFLAP